MRTRFALCALGIALLGAMLAPESDQAQTTISLANLKISGTFTDTGIQASSGSFCLQINSSGVISNTGSACAGAGVNSWSGDGSFASNSASTGTVTMTLATAGAHKWWGNNTGSTATPGYQSLTGADLPNPSSSSLGGIQSFASVAHQWINAISTSGVPSATQPTLADIAAGASGSGIYDYSGATQIKLPVAAGYTSAANGEHGYDSTNLNWHLWANGADMLLLPCPTSGITSGHVMGFLKTTNTWTCQDLGALPSVPSTFLNDVVVSFSTTPTFTCSTTLPLTIFEITLTASVASSTLTCPAGAQAMFVITQNATGAYTFAWRSMVKNPGTPNTTASSISVQTFGVTSGATAAYPTGPMTYN